MTGRELKAWIDENEAEDLELLFLQDDGCVCNIKPEIMENKIVKENYWEAKFLPDEGRCVLL